MRLTGGFKHEASRQVLSWEEKKKKKKVLVWEMLTAKGMEISHET